MPKPYDPLATLRAMLAADRNVSPAFRAAIAPDEICDHGNDPGSCDRCVNQREYEAGLRDCRDQDEERRYRSRNRPVLGIGGGY